MSGIKDNAGTIFAVVSIVGSVAVAIFSAKDTLKAKEKVDEANKKKIEETGEELTTIETVKVCYKCYWRTGLSFILSNGCMLLSDGMHKKKLAASLSASASAYAAVTASFSSYKDKVEELYGEGASKKVEESLVQDNIRERMERNPFEKYPDDDGMNLYYIMPTGIVDNSSFLVECTEAEMLTNILEMNRMYSLRGEVSINDLRMLFGQDKVDYGDILGWGWHTIEDCDCYFLDHFDVVSKMEGGSEVHNISFIWDADYFDPNMRDIFTLYNEIH